MTRTNIISALAGTLAITSVSFLLATGCLSTTEEDYSGSFGTPGELDLYGVPSTGGVDDGTVDTGDKCEELKECVCEDLGGAYAEKCKQVVDSMSEAECADWLYEYGCYGYYYYDDDDDDYYDYDDYYYDDYYGEADTD